MKADEIADPIFREAVKAIDSGNISRLEQLVDSHPDLVSRRLDAPSDGYFKNPYLLWFIADNPIRQERLPKNIVDIADLLISQVRKNASESLRDQVDYTFGLVATGRITRECGVQIDLLDLLTKNGANPGDPSGALAHGNIEAARHIVNLTGKMTLTSAICLDQMEEVKKRLGNATSEEKQVGLMAAAFYGKPEMISILLESGVNVNGYITSGFHSHASPLHQAVSSGSLEAVKLLVQAGADLSLADKIYDGTPLDWANYLQKETDDEAAKARYKEIEIYLRSMDK